ncbi:MAG: hypothetical protein P8Q36_09215 [Alphaproteobacteria bacterium]|jgi:hypothetical protein|nr:hypothetical protein [Rhodospirillaceae bacterium]MBT6204484.1 hypothetical protein [Rhodospirillaceae bacterium]MDG2481029.1 hypothetical protein [Alphaproteobacteria bacterium]
MRWRQTLYVAAAIDPCGKQRRHGYLVGFGLSGSSFRLSPGVFGLLAMMEGYLVAGQQTAQFSLGDLSDAIHLGIPVWIAGLIVVSLLRKVTIDFHRRHSGERKQSRPGSAAGR